MDRFEPVRGTARFEDISPKEFCPLIGIILLKFWISGQKRGFGSGSVWTLCVTPAMAGGVTGSLWKIADIVNVLD